MYLILDENVPAGVAEMLTQNGHKAEFIRDYVPPGSPDPLVATVAQELKAILVSFDGDFQKIAPRIPYGQRNRFKKLDRIWMRCGEPQARRRLGDVLDFVDAEYQIAEQRSGIRMRLCIGLSFLRTDR